MIEFGVLGPLVFLRDGKRQTIQTAMLRRLLALLLTRAGTMVSADMLIDSMWLGAPPQSARRTLTAYVSRLRTLLGPDDRVDASPGFYALYPQPGELDSATFRSLAADATILRASGDGPAAASRLRDGLALWRGTAYEDLRGLPVIAAEADALEQLKLASFEEWADLELDAGHNELVLQRLAPMIDEHPYRERLRGQRMLALHRSGRQIDALETYRETYQLLITDLGIHPAAALTQLHQQIVDGDTMPTGPSLGNALAVQPAQLPLAARGFAGRVSELDRLDQMLTGPDAQAGTVTVIVVSGMGGVGKTALMLHWAHRIAERYPDGQVYLDLRGHSEHDQVTPIGALAAVLTSFGLKPEQIPADPIAAAAVFRTTVAGRRLLFMLDNARSADQIRPLLPGGGGCTVLVTSRHRLVELQVHNGALAIDLDALRPAEAEQLLTDLTDRPGVGDPVAVSEIARLCAYLPLALRIAAARLAEHPERGVDWLRDELAGDDRLDALQLDGDEGIAVRAAFDLSYRYIPADAQRLFTLLGLIPGTDFDVEAVAALADLPLPAIRRGLGHLATVHLIRSRPDGRYDFHDLIREYAHGLAVACAERDAALDRLYSWYRRGTATAASILFQRITMLPPDPAGPTAVTAGPEFSDGTAATAWLDSEYRALTAAIRHSIQNGQAAVGIRLADSLRAYLLRHAALSDWLTLTAAATTAAHLTGDLRAEAAAHLHTGTAYGVRDEYRQAITYLKLAHELAQRSGWTAGATAARANLAGMYLRTGEVTLAHEAIVDAIEAFTSLGDDATITTAKFNLGQVLVDMGRPEAALAVIDEVFAATGGFAASARPAEVLDTYGLACHRTGQHQAARQHLARAVEAARQLGDRTLETATLAHLAAVAIDQGDLHGAWDLANQATVSAQSSGQQSADAIVLSLTAALHIRAGNAAIAIRQAARAHELAGTVGARRPQIEALINLAAAHRLAGDADTATDIARQAEDLATQSGFVTLARQAADILAQLNGCSGSVRRR